MIYTSYFAQIKNFPKNIIPIAICGGLPQWYSGLWYKKPAPKYKFFMEWKQNQDNNFYIEHYNKEVLDGLDKIRVLNEIHLLIPENIRAQMDAPVWRSNNIHVALICYEKPEDFCHRHLFAEWLRREGVKIEEWHK